MDSHSFQSIPTSLFILAFLAAITACVGVLTQSDSISDGFTLILNIALMAVLYIVHQRSNRTTQSEAEPSPACGIELKPKHRPPQLDLSCSAALARRLSKIAYQSPLLQPKTPTTVVGSTFYSDPECCIHKQLSPNHLSTPTPIRMLSLANLSRNLEAQLGPLPEGWGIHLSSNQRVFFVDKTSGETTWQDPRLASSTPLPSHDPEESALFSPIKVYSPAGMARISGWIAEDAKKFRARDARVTTLRRRAQMARQQIRTHALSLFT